MIDLGGGSAELILSEHGRMAQAFSKPLGALRLKEVFLKSDPPDPRELHRMEEYIQERIVDAVKRFGNAPYDRATQHLPQRRGDLRRGTVPRASGDLRTGCARRYRRYAAS
jgi:hypothetical protein